MRPPISTRSRRSRRRFCFASAVVGSVSHANHFRPRHSGCFIATQLPHPQARGGYSPTTGTARGRSNTHPCTSVPPPFAGNPRPSACSRSRRRPAELSWSLEPALDVRTKMDGTKARSGREALVRVRHTWRMRTSFTRCWLKYVSAPRGPASAAVCAAARTTRGRDETGAGS